MKVMIVEDQTMIRSLLESYFRTGSRRPFQARNKQSRCAGQILSI